MTGGSVMDWWGEGRGARPLVVRDMSSGARDRTCVGGDLSASLGHSRALVRRGEALEQKTILSQRTMTKVPKQRVSFHETNTQGPGFHTTLKT